jgi:hypothetical protein
MVRRGAVSGRIAITGEESFKMIKMSVRTLSEKGIAKFKLM